MPAVADFISLPFYDLFAEDGHVLRIRKDLPPLLTGVRRSILEIGAGSGLITTSLADWTPAEIFALEPSAGMRGMLLARLNSRPELLNRVTVLPGDALSVTLDEPVEAVVMINVMYALEPDYRKRLWPVLAAALDPGGLLVFTWKDGGPPAPHPLRELGSRQVGRHAYTVLLEILDADGEAFRRPLSAPDHRRRQAHQRRRDHRLRLPPAVERARARTGDRGLHPGRGNRRAARLAAQLRPASRVERA